MMESEAQKLITMLTTAFPDAWRFLDKDQQADTRALYRQLMGDLDYVIANAAILRLIATCKKMPVIAEIRQACSRQLDGRDDRGGEAWGKLLKLIGRYGRDRTPGVDFEVVDPVLARVIDSFGWRELCASENQTADRARVIELYEQLVLQASEDRSVRQLAPPIPRRSVESGGPAALSAIVAGMLPEKVPT